MIKVENIELKNKKEASCWTASLNEIKMFCKNIICCLMIVGLLIIGVGCAKNPLAPMGTLGLISENTNLNLGIYGFTNLLNVGESGLITSIKIAGMSGIKYEF